MVVLSGCAGRAPLHTEVRVEFAQRVATQRNVSGFLHGIEAERPPDSLIDPLRPGLWRLGQLTSYERVKRSGAQVVLVVSDTWGYPSYHGEHGWPPDDFAAWEATVRLLARTHRDKSLLWEIWNEPDAPEFWRGDYAAFLETYARAYRVLREELGPKALIGGPSLSRFDPELLDRFAAFCIARGCEANFLAWHELGEDVSSLESHLRTARARYIEGLAYSALRTGALHVNESVAQASQQRPGALVAIWYHLEHGGAAAAARSCWTDAPGESNCFNATLDGLLTPVRLEPTIAWWTQLAYAAGLGGRVESTTDNQAVTALASVGSSTSAPQLLIGYAPVARNAVMMDARIVLHGVEWLHSGDVVRVQRFAADTRGRAVTHSPAARAVVLEMADGAAVFTLTMQPNEAYLVSVVK